MASLSWVVSVASLLLVLFRGVVSQEFGFIVAGYLPDYRSYINVNATAPFLTDLLLFSIQPPASTKLDGSCCLGEDHYQIAREAQAYKLGQGYGELRLWVTAGGGGRSESFASIAADRELRSNFINELVQLW